MTSDRGSYTAEFATSLPAVVLLLLTGLTGVDALVTKVRCVDAAREAARAAARGEAPDSLARRYAPDGATVSVQFDGDLVRATVRATARPLGGHLPGFDIEAGAVAAVEPR
jgi:hypothetical protein